MGGGGAAKVERRHIGHGNQPHENTLKGKNREQAPPPEMLAVVSAHPLITEVFLTFAAPAQKQMQPEARAPQNYQAARARAAGLRFSLTKGRLPQ